jgi:hypothetical protein
MKERRRRSMSRGTEVVVGVTKDAIEESESSGARVFETTMLGLMFEVVKNLVDMHDRLEAIEENTTPKCKCGGN